MLVSLQMRSLVCLGWRRHHNCAHNQNLARQNRANQASIGFLRGSLSISLRASTKLVATLRALPPQAVTAELILLQSGPLRRAEKCLLFNASIKKIRWADQCCRNCSA